MAMDRDIEHICDEVGIPRNNRAKMVEYGICTVQDLMQIREGIEKEEWEYIQGSQGPLSGLRSDVRKHLLLVIKWREANQNADIIEVFNGEVFDKILNDESWADDYIMNVMGRPNLNANVSLGNCLAGNGGLLLTVIRKCKDKIMESPNLRYECGKFDYELFLDKSIRNFVRESRGLVMMETIYVLAAPTQSGKTSVEGVIQSMCGMFCIPLVILTKGVGESINLHAKLVRLSAGTLVKEKHIVVGESF
jgi:hypothetical protein